MPELITENEIGRLKHYSSHGGFGIPRYAGEVVVVRFERSGVFLENMEEYEHDNWKLPADVGCSIWMMDSVGEFIDCVLDPDSPALDGCISVSSEMNSYLPRAQVDLNAVQASGTGIVIVSLTTKSSSIYEVIKNLTVYLDVINPSTYRSRDSYSKMEEREVWNIFSFSPVEDKSIYDIDESWNNIAVIMFFIYADRWHIKPLSHMSLANSLNERIRISKNLCYALNNIILRDLELPEGCRSIRSLLIGDGSGSNTNNNNNKIKNKTLGLDDSDDIDLEGPLLVKHSSSITDYKFLLNRLKERKDFLKEFLEKNKEKIIHGKVIIDQDGNVNYCNSADLHSKIQKTPTEESFYEGSESEFYPQPNTLESTNKDIQILKQEISEMQLQLVGIMDMFMASSPASFTVQGTTNDITYKSLLEEIQHMESALILHRESLQTKMSEVSSKFVVTDNDKISTLQPVISNAGYTELIYKMEKLRQSVELYGRKSREAVIDNKSLLNESREFAFNKIKSIEIMFDKLNHEFNNFLFSISCSSVPTHVSAVN